MQYGIRPDGAARVLNLLGGALQDEVSIPGCTQELLAKRSEESFQGTFNEHLAQSVQCLDERVSEIRKEIMANVRQRYEHELADFWLLKEKEDQKKKGKERKISLAKEHLEDAQEMPFSVRLATVRNIARLNLARMCIMRYLGSRKNEDIEYVKMLASQIQDSLERYGSFYTPIARQLAAIKEIVFIVSGQEIDPAPNVTTAAAPDLQSPQEARSDATLEQLKERLEQAKSDEDRVKIHNQRAAKHLQEAQEKSKISHLKSLDSWQEAQKDYDSALGLIKDDTTASLGNARCLIGLAQYGQALQFLKEHPSINDTPDFWIMASIAYRKQCDYTKAKEYILEALQLDPQNKEAVREKAVIDKLIAKTEGKKRAAYTKPQLQYEESYLEARREGKKQHYTILAIDGGGVRGVVPALWLNKLEERTRRPIAHLFNMLAGTSTGGIITTALSVPSEQTPSTPRYAASEIVELYRQKSPKIFPPEKRKDTNLLSSKYTDAGRSAVFTEYFKQYRLKDALTELVIPAVRSENTTTTYVFTRNKAEKNDADNVTLYDAVMATTAAPTFFPAYQIDGKGIFFDGSIQAGNPAQQAYDEACCVTSKENILMLSMGAGTCISDPLQPDLHCGKLFWAGNYPRVSLALQEGGTDRSMRISLGEDRYQRWQVWLENPIGLDDCQQIDTLLELGEQYIEELYASQDNTMNKLLERLEDHAPLAAQGPSQAVNQKMV